jgi:hypothetical protein
MSNKPNYVAEAPYQPGYEDAVVTESKPVLYGIYKSKSLTHQRITELWTLSKGDYILFARAIEEAHNIR